MFDSNARVLADAIRELGAEPAPFGIVPDDLDKLRDVFRRAVAECDVVVLSGGTSKGSSDVSYRVVGEFGPPGIVVHGVALKPGKPLCLAVAAKSPRPVPVAVLPGFPTSAIFTFQEFIAPILNELAGRPPSPTDTITAVLPARVNSERGRTEFVLVGLVPGNDSSLVAVPMGKGSGSVTAFGRADGFITIPRQREYLEAGERVEVRLLGAGVRPADLIVIGSHCIGLDFLLGRLRSRGFTAKVLAVGSTAGLEAARRGHCDLAGVHLLDPATDTYNRAFLDDSLELIPGYGRLQGIVFRRGDARFEGKDIVGAVVRRLPIRRVFSSIATRAAELECSSIACSRVRHHPGSSPRPRRTRRWWPPWSRAGRTGELPSNRRSADRTSASFPFATSSTTSLFPGRV